MSLFFSLLPTDLHIDILCGWLNEADCGRSLLKVLVALDVVCSQSDRPTLHFAMGQLPAFGDCSTYSLFNQGVEHTENALSRATQHIAQCLQWLGSRSIPVKTLLLAGSIVEGLQALEPNLTVSSIETLQWADSHNGVTREHLSAVLKCLPNLTAIHTSCVTVDLSLTPKLKALSINYLTPSMQPFMGCCPQLRELRIEHVTLTTVLVGQVAHSCPNLQLLEVSVIETERGQWSTVRDVWVRNRHMGLDILLKLLRSLKSLEELIVHGVNVFIGVRLVSFPNIKRLSFAECKLNAAMVTDLLSYRPDLESLTVNAFRFSRSQRLLELPRFLDGHSAASELSEIMKNLACCGSLEVLTATAHLDSNMLAILTDKVDGTLKSLTLHTEDLQIHVLQDLLQRNGSSLTSLDLNLKLYCGRFEYCPLPLIAATCSHLTILSLRLSSCCKEDDFSLLFVACPAITELALETSCTNIDRQAPLRAIVSSRMRLRLLKLVGSFNEADAAWFGQLIRDNQLLPLPKIVSKT